MEQANQAGSVFSVEKVLDELSAGTDDLSVWAKARPSGFFLPVDPQVLSAMSQVSQWVMAQNSQQAAINEFFAAADYYLVSAALAHTYTVVTSEVPAASVKRIKIPNVCIGLNVPFANTFQMLRTERASFVLR
jgi:hypothetical protein